MREVIVGGGQRGSQRRRKWEEEGKTEIKAGPRKTASGERAGGGVGGWESEGVEGQENRKR